MFGGGLKVDCGFVIWFWLGVPICGIVSGSSGGFEFASSGGGWQWP